MPLKSDPLTIPLVTPLPAAGAAPNPLPVPQVYQRAEEWCWAACVQMALNYYGDGNIQCEVVNKQFGQTKCCDTPDDPACNDDLSLPDIAAVYRAWHLGAKCITSAVQFDYLEREINAGRPVQVGFAWNTGGNHVALVCGTNVDGTVQFVRVNDPLYGSGWVHYAALLGAYYLGSWQWTWVSIAKG